MTAAFSQASNEEVILKTVDTKGLIVLNRPKALNSLNLTMIRKIFPQMTVRTIMSIFFL